LHLPAVDPVAEGGFASAADHYRRSRPTYAREAIGLLKERLPSGPVVDLAAGTGILTGQLRRAGREVVAVEPLAEMLAQLRLAQPGVPGVQAVAECLPLRGGEIAAVTVAQAFHWFDAAAALAELARVLAPGGVLAMVWNVRDESVPWVGGLADLIEARSGARPYTEHPEHPWEEVVERDGRFEHLDTHRFANPVPSGVESVLERVRSTSSVAVMPEREREALVTEAAGLLARTPGVGDRERFDYPHHTVVHIFELRSRTR
jgi:SAM-dependent methyltransferase